MSTYNKMPEEYIEKRLVKNLPYNIKSFVSIENIKVTKDGECRIDGSAICYEKVVNKYIIPIVLKCSLMKEVYAQIDITNLQYKWPINRCGFQEHWIPIKEIINMKKK